MGDLGVDEEYGDVPVGMGAGKVNGADFFVVEEHGCRLLKRNHGQGNRRRRLNVPLAKFTTRRQAFADVGVGQNRGVLAKGAVAAGVVAVEMGVEDVLGLAVKTGQCGAYRIGLRRQFGIYQKNAIVTDANPDIAATTLQHVHRVAELVKRQFSGRWASRQQGRD